MRSGLIPILAAGLILAGLAPSPDSSAAPTADEKPVLDLPKGIEVQTRGLVHEAFAQPPELKPEPGPEVPQQPPDPVPEEPPKVRPEGENVQWIPGYWAWDADRNDFTWISGTLRNGPSGRQYVAGYWTKTDNGWRWVQGFWAAAGQGEFPYLPQPPAPLEYGPSLPPPDEDCFYIPGCWVYRDGAWYWRPGFWARCRPGRVWTAARNFLTPRGCIYVDGYWDYPLEDRGLLFAPVYFSEPWWRRPGWCYRPVHVLRFGGLLDSLFVRRGGYFFGDYYGSSYARLGFSPWFAGQRHDPLFSYYRWNQRNNPGWVDGLRQTYTDRNAGRLATPPRTFAQTGSKGPGPNSLVTSLADSKIRLVKSGEAQVAAQKAGAGRLREIAQTRQQLETKTAKTARTLKLPTGTLGALTPAQGAKTAALPRSDPGKNPLSSLNSQKNSGENKKPPQGMLTPPLSKGTPRGTEKTPLLPTPPNSNPRGPGEIKNAASADLPKINSPKQGNRGGDSSAPRVTTPPASGLKLKNTPPNLGAPPKGETPRNNPAPRIYSSPAPKNSSPPALQPRSNPAPAPRINSPPPKYNPAPRFNPTPAPRINSPAPKYYPAPRFNPSPAPRIHTPAPAPKYSAPPRASSPRPSAPSTRSYSPPSQPRYGGSAPRGGGSPRGGGGKR